MKKLKAENLFFERKGGFSLGPLSLDCGEGEILALVGPNGGGKSTLLALLAGILKPFLGEIFLNEESLGKKERKGIAREIGFLPQRVAPGYTFSAGEVVSMGLFSMDRGGLEKPDVSEAVLRAMEKTLTSSFYERPFQELSGGEQQRVLLSSLLVRSPEILLLDEPTSDLDPHHGVEFFRLLKKESASGLSAIVACHDVNLATTFSDRMIFMDHGKILASGKPSAILEESVFVEACAMGMKVWPHPDGKGGFVLLPEREEAP